MADITQAVIDTLIAEAGGEGEAGLIATAWAMQQRAAARGQTLDQVIRSGFDGYSNPGSGSRKNQQNPTLRAQAERILQGVTNGSIPNPVPGADHFLSGDVMPNWANNMKHVATVGGHRYYASGKVPQDAYGPLIPRGELPEVATLTDTVPPRPGVPVTASPDLQLLRNAPRYADVPAPRKRPQTAMDILRVANLDTASRPDWVDSMYTGRAVKTPDRITDKDLLFDAGIADTVAKTAALQDDGLAAALEGYIRKTPTQGQAKRRNATAAEVAAAGQDAWTAADGPLVSTRRQSPTTTKRTAAELATIYQGGGPTRPSDAPRRNATAAQVAAAGQGGMPFSAADGPAIRLDTAPRLSTKKPMPGQSGTVLQNSEPMPQGAPRPRPQTERPRQQSYAGQEATPVPGRLPRIGPTGGPPLNNNAPKPATQSLDLAIRRAPGTVVAEIAPNSNLGKPPIERAVKTIPMPGSPLPGTKTPAQMAMDRAKELYRYGGPSTGLAGAPRLTANTVPGPNSPPKAQERLGPTRLDLAHQQAQANAPLTMFGTTPVVGNPVQTALTRNVQLPRARPRLETDPMGGGNAVATQLDVTQPGLPPSGTGPLLHGTLRNGTNGKTYAWHQSPVGGGQWQLFDMPKSNAAPPKRRGGFLAGLGGLGQIGNMLGGLLQGAPRLGGARSLGPSDYFLAATGMTDSGISENHRTPSIGAGLK